MLIPELDEAIEGEQPEAVATIEMFASVRRTRLTIDARAAGGECRQEWLTPEGMRAFATVIQEL